VKWHKETDGYYATEDARSADMHYDVINDFLDIALMNIFEAYNTYQIPAIIFDLWPQGRLKVFDSPDGLELNRRERALFCLTHIAFAKYEYTNIKNVIDKHGSDSQEFDNMLIETQKLTWDSVIRSISNGKAKSQLEKFGNKPSLIMITESYDGIAHDLLTGERIAMLGSPIEEESQVACQCLYCNSTNSHQNFL